MYDWGLMQVQGGLSGLGYLIRDVVMGLGRILGDGSESFVLLLMCTDGRGGCDEILRSWIVATSTGRFEMYTRYLVFSQSWMGRGLTDVLIDMAGLVD